MPATQQVGIGSSGDDAEVEEPLPGWFVEMGQQQVPPDADDVAKAAHARRREQIRRAQRTHRERKEKYIKSLEAEVTQLRERDASHDKEVKAYRQHIKVLEKLLEDHYISFPKQGGLMAETSISVFDRADGSQALRAALPFLRHDSSTSNYSETSSGTNPPGGEFTGASGRGAGAIQPYPHYLNSTQVAVDFILDLEQPCLCHHRTHTFPDNETNGHALMLQSPILAHCPAPLPTTSKSERLPTSLTWNIPAWEIEKLLLLSGSLRSSSLRQTLAGEITPVEAWWRVVQHPGFRAIDALPRLKKLKELMFPEIMCFGFGAAIDEEYFEILLNQVFSI